MYKIFTLIVLSAFLVGCGGEAENENASPAFPQLLEGLDSGLQVVSTESGLHYVDIVVGEGAQPETGQIVSAHYRGWVMDGEQFDSSYERGRPIEFPIGVGRVIKGWDEGLGSMKVGGKRRLLIPSELGYGQRSAAGGKITPGATLLFDVELMEVK